jgi:hypothetical protein
MTKWAKAPYKYAKKALNVISRILKFTRNLTGNQCNFKKWRNVTKLMLHKKQPGGSILHSLEFI